MEELEPIFNSTGNWSKCLCKKGVGSDGVFRKDQIKFQTSDKEFFNSLKELGFLEKSLVSPKNLLDKIPENLLQYWWRGYWDADGCFFSSGNKATANLVCSYNQELVFFEDLLNELNILYKTEKRIYTNKKTNKTSKWNRTTIRVKAGIVEFGNYLYQDRLDIGLKRKYEKYLRIKSQPIEIIKLFTYDGVTRTVKDWRNIIGISNYIYKQRIERGWSLEQSLLIPKNEDKNFKYGKL